MWRDLQDRLARDGTVTFAVRARPGAPRTEATDVLADGSMKIALAAAAEDGEANAELVRYLSGVFGTRGVEVLSGRAARRKLVRVTR